MERPRTLGPKGNGTREHRCAQNRLIVYAGTGQSAVATDTWCATIMKSASATTMMAGGEESKAA
jgi:hypothetical protein